MNFVKRLLLLVLMSFAVVMPVRAEAFFKAVLVDDVTVAVPPGLPPDKTENAILFAMNQQKWAAESRDPGHVVAVLRIRVHMAKVRIDYDAKAIHIHYLDSTNLEYEEDGDVRKIHSNYNSWVSNLARDMQSFLYDQAALAAPERK